MSQTVGKIKASLIPELRITPKQSSAHFRIRISDIQSVMHESYCFENYVCRCDGDGEMRQPHVDTAV